MRTESECEAVSVSAHVFSSSRSFWAATDDSVQDWRLVFSKNKDQVILLSLSCLLSVRQRELLLCGSVWPRVGLSYTHTLYTCLSHPMSCSRGSNCVSLGTAMTKILHIKPLNTPLLRVSESWMDVLVYVHVLQSALICAIWHICK